VQGNATGAGTSRFHPLESGLIAFAAQDR